MPYGKVFVREIPDSPTRRIDEIYQLEKICNNRNEPSQNGVNVYNLKRTWDMRRLDGDGNIRGDRDTCWGTNGASRKLKKFHKLTNAPYLPRLHSQ